MKKLCTLLLLALLPFMLDAQQPGTWESKGSGITATNRVILGTSVVDSNTLWGITLNPSFNTPFREFTRTVDGGKTWTSGVIDPTETDFYFNLGIFALDANTAWVNMGNGNQDVMRIYKTTDGGQTWTQQNGSFNDEGNGAELLHFFNENEGVFLGSPGTGDPTVDSLKIWRTSDGGNTWHRIPSEQLPTVLAEEGRWINLFNGTYDAIGDTLWFGTRRGRIWRSVDKGVSWEAFSFGEDIYDAAISVAFKDSKNGIAGGDGPRQGFRTQDGGATWEKITLPSSIAYYQIEYVPGTAGVYFLAYEASPFFLNNIQHAYTLNNGDNWVMIDNPEIECFEFLSSTNGWGGGRIFNHEQGGMYNWRGNLERDYFALGAFKRTTPYTIMTPRQLDTVRWDLTLTNGGYLPLTNVGVDFNITGNSFSQEQQAQITSLSFGETSQLPVSFYPNRIGTYIFSSSVSNAQLGDNFFQDSEQFELSASIMAKDDGTQESQLGFGFGNPNWYGYYGSAFDLKASDTLTAITVYISRFSDFTGSINLTVNAFDATGRPNTELFHSEKIILSEHGITSSNNKLTYTLETPLPLESGRYVFAAGQDTLQGRIGFDFDLDNVSAEGFWLVSPVAGGGYPWANARNREHLMIRPHFKTKQLTTSTQEPSDITSYIKLYPNPFTDQTLLEFELKDHSQPVEITITDVIGRQLSTLSLKTPNAGINQIPITVNAPAGLLVLTLQQGTGVKTVRLVKQ